MISLDAYEGATLRALLAKASVAAAHDARA